MANNASCDPSFLKSVGLAQDCFRFDDPDRDSHADRFLQAVLEGGSEQHRFDFVTNHAIWALIFVRKRFIRMTANRSVEKRDRAPVIWQLLSAQPSLITDKSAEYRLTPVETRLVWCTVSGQTVREASDAMRISYNTARKYLQTIFAKISTCRQTELVALMRKTERPSER